MFKAECQRNLSVIQHSYNYDKTKWRFDIYENQINLSIILDAKMELIHNEKEQKNVLAIAKRLLIGKKDELSSDS